MTESFPVKEYSMFLNVIWAFFIFCTLFFIFTPFEDEGYIAVILPRVAILCCIAVVSPFIVLKPYRSLRPALVLLVATLFHLTFFIPTEPVQLLAEWVAFISLIFFSRMLVDKVKATSIAISLLLLVNIIALGYQYIDNVFLGNDLDLHKLIYPISVDARTGQVVYQEFTRIGGIHLEPGTYCTWIAMLVVLSRLIKQKFGVLELFATLSMLITYSTAGIIYCALIMFWFLLESLKIISFGRIGVLVFMVSGGIFLGSAVGVDGYILKRFGINVAHPAYIEEGSDQLEWRKDAIDFYKKIPIADKLVGIGHTQEICVECHFDDFGFAPNMFIRGGVLGLIGLVVTCFLFLKLLGFNMTFLLLAILGTAKAPTNAMAVWVVLMVASEIGIRSYRYKRIQKGI